MTPIEALEHALAYLDGVRETAGTDINRDAELLLEHLVKGGFVLKTRNRYDRVNLSRTVLNKRGLGPGQIRDMREKVGLSVGDLARKSGVAAGTIVAIERGDNRPQDRSIQAIMDALARAKAGVE